MYCPSCDHALVAIDLENDRKYARPAAVHQCEGCGSVFLEYLVGYNYECALLPLADYLRSSHGMSFDEWADARLFEELENLVPRSA